MFPVCSPRVFSIAPRFSPICFAQSPPLNQLYESAKGREISNFGIIF
jgi:hypothetical protein